MKFLLYLFISTNTFLSCSKQNIDYGPIAVNQAKRYYDALIEERYDEYIDATFHEEKIPNEYRQQLIDNAKMFIQQQKEEREGISRIEIIKGNADSLGTKADAFLMLFYGDSTKEEIVVPMVNINGKWLLR